MRVIQEGFILKNIVPRIIHPLLFNTVNPGKWGISNCIPSPYSESPTGLTNNQVTGTGLPQNLSPDHCVVWRTVPITIFENNKGGKIKNDI